MPPAPGQQRIVQVLAQRWPRPTPAGALTPRARAAALTEAEAGHQDECLNCVVTIRTVARLTEPL